MVEEKTTTKRMEQLRRRMAEEDKGWLVQVRNSAEKNGEATVLDTYFKSSGSTLKDVLHKLELDLMTNLHLGNEDMIQVSIGALTREELRRINQLKLYDEQHNLSITEKEDKE